MRDIAFLFKSLWAAWLAIWLFAAPWSRRTVVRQPTGERLTYLVPMVLGAIFLFITTTPATFLGHNLLPAAPWESWAGLALTAAGLAFSVWARFSLGRLWSARVTLKTDHRLVQEGPYGVIRHPIYTGLLLAVLGTALARDTIAVAVGFFCIAVSMVIKIRQEDTLLAGHFGPAFDEYRHRVRTLIPFVW